MTRTSRSPMARRSCSSLASRWAASSRTSKAGRLAVRRSSFGATTYKRKGSHELLFDLRAITDPTAAGIRPGRRRRPASCWGFKVVHRDYLSTRDYGNKEIIPKIADLRADKAVTVMKKGVPIEGRVVDADGKPVAGARVISASSQQIYGPKLKRSPCLPTQRAASERGRSSRVNGFSWPARRDTGREISESSRHGDPAGRDHPRPMRTLKGRVVDPDGKPVAGAFVNVDIWKAAIVVWESIFGPIADGRFRWDDGPTTR